jgi:hypothetical protein
MKYILLSLLLLFSCGGPGTPGIPAANPPVYIPHSNFTEAEVESAMFSYWSEISNRAYKCQTILGSWVYFVNEKSAKKNYHGVCYFMPRIMVVNCSNSVNTNHLITDKTIWWSCQTYFLDDDFVHNKVYSDNDIILITRGIRTGEYGL